ncbi:MAG: IS200/IS605 family transposase [Chitinophagales bacterium]|nr:IS200/IS605 family transposase [Chitinophagales bacterium]
MPHSYNKLWTHAIWATKDRYPLILPEIESILYGYITEQFKSLDCPVSIINGMNDHIHCLFLLNPQKSISEIIKQIKGSSSHFLNQSDLIKEKFS